MPFIGTPVVTQISDDIVRITGISVGAESIGTIGLHGSSADIQLPASFQPQPYSRSPSGHPVIGLQDSVLVDVANTAATATAVALAIAKSGTTPSDFLITLSNTDETGVPLGTALTFALLAHTYTNAAAGVVLTGDLGYAVAPATNPTVSGATHNNDATYLAAGAAQAAALADLRAVPATFTFAPGNIDLATDTTHGAAGQFGPGVYDVTGNMSIGAGGITLTGVGTGLFIFRCTGTFTTAGASTVTLAGTSDTNRIFWIANGAASLGAASSFDGSLFANAGLTLGATVTWTGRALAFGGTVTTALNDQITVPEGSGNPTTALEIYVRYHT